MLSFLSLILLVVVAGAHTCLHSEVNQGREPLLRAPQRTMKPLAAGREPIRLRGFFERGMMKDCKPFKCICEAAGDIVTDIKTGGSQTCGSEDVLTPAKESYLHTVLGEAFKRIGEVLKVDRTAGPLRPASGKGGPQDTICGRSSSIGIRIPTEHITDGVPDADFVVYGTAMPSEGDNVAWAIPCQEDDSFRPIVAQVNISPRTLDPQSPSTSPAKHANTVALAVHEVLHALGFTNAYWDHPSWFKTTRKAGARVLRNMKGPYGDVVMLATPRVLEMAQKHFGCPSLGGMELENQGGSGTALLHWEKRLLGPELMTGSVGIEESVLSPITLAYFEDTGLYDVDYSTAEALWWGKDKGCRFATEKCNSLGAEEFCFPANPSTDALPLQCSHTLHGLGPCNLARYTSPLPEHHRYFTDPHFGGKGSLEDYCPSVGIARLCTDSPESCAGLGQTACSAQRGCHWQGRCLSIFSDIQGETQGTSSRCFMSDVLATGWRQQDARGRCFPVLCAQDGRSYHVEVKGFKLLCQGESPGNAVPPPGFSEAWQGAVPCHPASAICGGKAGVALGNAPGSPITPRTNPAVGFTDGPSPLGRTEEPEESFFEKNKTRIIIAGSAVVIAAILATVTYFFCRRHRPKQPARDYPPPKPVQSNPIVEQWGEFPAGPAPRA